MKTKAIFLSLLFLVMCIISTAQETNKNYLFSYKGKKKEHTVGMYGSLGGTYSTVMDESANWLTARVGVVIDEHWGIGLAHSALNYDHELSQLVTDGTYHLQGAYSGMFLEYLVPFNNWGKLSISWTSGMGLLFYQYDKEYRKALTWTDEYIDAERFAANEFGAEFMIHVAGNWWVGLEGSYRNTSPIKMLGVEEDVLQKFNAGITVRYGIF
jgi:hypothetical protein